MPLPQEPPSYLKVSRCHPLPHPVDTSSACKPPHPQQTSQLLAASCCWCRLPLQVVVAAAAHQTPHAGPTPVAGGPAATDLWEQSAGTVSRYSQQVQSAEYSHLSTVSRYSPQVQSAGTANGAGTCFVRNCLCCCSGLAERTLQADTRTTVTPFTSGLEVCGPAGLKEGVATLQCQPVTHCCTIHRSAPSHLPLPAPVHLMVLRSAARQMQPTLPPCC